MNQKGGVLLEFITALFLLTLIFSVASYALQKGWKTRLKEYGAFQKSRQALLRKQP